MSSQASALKAVSITVNTTAAMKCRAVYVGVSQNIDLCVNGEWVLFKGATAGSIINVQATGARKNTASAAPDAGDIVFLY